MKPAAIASSRQVPVSRLVEGPNPWREKNFSTKDLQDSLSRSPMLAPLVVRWSPTHKGMMEVIAGHRRLRAAKAQGWSHVEVRLVDADDDHAELLGLEENLRRKAVHNEPKALARLLDLYKRLYPESRGRPRKAVQLGQEKPPTSAMQMVAKTTGKSLRETRRMVLVGNATNDIQVAYAEGQINVLQAEKLATLPPEEKDQQLQAMITSRPQPRTVDEKQIKLLTVPKMDEVSRAMDALRYVLKNFQIMKPEGQIRDEAIKILTRIRKEIQ